MDGERLLEEAETIELDLTGVEAIAAVAHAIYKEHIYLLSDYYVTKEWLNRKMLSLAEELKAEEAVEMALRLNKQIRRGGVEAPIKLKPIQVMGILIGKFVEDSNFRVTTINILKLAVKRRTMQQLIQRIKRKAY
ncbi:MAG: hypothetical protein QW655_03305 [Nitrososphaerota archaeon]